MYIFCQRKTQNGSIVHFIHPVNPSNKQEAPTCLLKAGPEGGSQNPGPCLTLKTQTSSPGRERTGCS